MAVSEEEVKIEEQIQEDFKQASDVMDRIVKKFGKTLVVYPELLFALCLLYVRLLNRTEKK